MLQFCHFICVPKMKSFQEVSREMVAQDPHRVPMVVPKVRLFTIPNFGLDQRLNQWPEFKKFPPALTYNSLGLHIPETLVFQVLGMNPLNPRGIFFPANVPNQSKTQTFIPNFSSTHSQAPFLSRHTEILPPYFSSILCSYVYFPEKRSNHSIDSSNDRLG